MYKLVDWQPLSSLKCPDSAGGGANCMGPSVIIRMSFVLATMHVIVLIFASTRGTVAAIFHDGCWGTKFLYVLGFFIGSIWIPNSFFIGYLTFAKYVSFLFLFMQGMLMLMVAYKINDGLVGNYERDGSQCSAIVIIFFTGTFTIGSVVWLVFQYIWFYGCGYNSAIISATLVAAVGFYVIVIFKTRPDSSLLTSSIVVLYLVYLQWSALASNPNTTCNPFNSSAVNTTMQIISGAIFTIACLIVISIATKKENEGNLTTKMNGALIENEDGDYEKLDAI
jgi:hypothetical protein